MPEKHVNPDPNTLDYQQKDVILKCLDSQANIDNLPDQLSALGLLLIRNPLLSRSQALSFMGILSKHKILTTKNDYLSSMDSLLSQDLNSKDIDGEITALSNNLDGVMWDIEQHPYLQIQVLQAAVRLLNPLITSSEQIAIGIGVLNFAHRATSSNNYAHRESSSNNYINFETEAINNSIKNHFREQQNTIYENRLPIATKLEQIRLLTNDDLEVIKSCSLEEFNNLSTIGDIYDKIAVMYLLPNNDINDIIGMVKELQKIVYFGYTMGAKDMIDQEKREYDDSI